MKSDTIGTLTQADRSILLKARHILQNTSEATLVCITTDGIVNISNQRGVAPLYHILQTDARSLAGAYVADKVIGRGSAALMALGKIKAYDTALISTDAKALLDAHGIPGIAQDICRYIINRAGTGRCPVESLLEPITDPMDLHSMQRIIAEFLAQRR